MSQPSKVWRVQDRFKELDYLLVRAESSNEAVNIAFKDMFEQNGCEQDNLEAERIPWLDRYDDLYSPEAARERKLHGWKDNPWISRKDAKNQHRLTMPIDTLPWAIDLSQCISPYGKPTETETSLNAASKALVDIAVSLRIIAGRPPVTDTPMQSMTRRAVVQGLDPIKDGILPDNATSYVQDVMKYINVDSEKSAGKRQEDGKESDSELSGEES